MSANIFNAEPGDIAETVLMPGDPFHFLEGKAIIRNVLSMFCSGQGIESIIF